MIIHALVFQTQSEADSKRAEIELRVPHDAGWHWGDVCELKDGKWFYSPPQHVLTEAEKSLLVDLSESDLPDPPPMP